MHIPALIVLVLSLAATPQQRAVEKVLRENPRLRGAQVSILAVNSKGDTLVNVASDRRLVPASNVKLLTSGAALRQLGVGYRFETAIAVSGDLTGGRLEGDVVIIGGGDPTLGSSYQSCIPADSTFAMWTSMLKKAGISRIEGRIIGDGRSLDGQAECPTWSYEDIGADYGAGPTGLNFNRNIQDFEVTPGLAVGDKVTAWPKYPDTPWMSFSYACVTGKAGTGDNLYLYNSDLAPVAELRGTYAVDREPRTIHCSNRFSALTCAHMFRRYLEAAGIPVSGGSADISPDGYIRPEHGFPAKAGAAPDSLSVLGRTASGPLRDIIRDLNHESDNFYAETLLRTLGKTMRSSACYDSSLVAISSVFRSMGLGAQSGGGARISDGSGLSRENYVSAAFFVAFLQKMAAGPDRRVYMASLPQPGRGTLTSRMARRPREFRSRFRMKSGSMDGVRCFSGYIASPDGSRADEIVFSVLVNNMTARLSAATDAVEELLVAIAR